MIDRIVYVPFDHLNLKHGALAKANPQTDLVVLVESKRMVSGRDWHKERLFFMISSARHFVLELEAKGFQVQYIKAANTIAGLEQAQKTLKNKAPIVCAEPSSIKQYEQLHNYGVEFVPNDFFLTPRDLFRDWASKQKSFVMENFYRLQRTRLGILVEDGKPVGGQWNFDQDNRLPPPKNYTWPAYLEQDRDSIDIEVAKELDLYAIFYFEYYATGEDNSMWRIEYHDTDYGRNEYKDCNQWGDRIKYVHQLQNLYFALTGEELTIKC